MTAQVAGPSSDGNSQRGRRNVERSQTHRRRGPVWINQNFGRFRPGRNCEP
jgi:hypothetical protein